MAAKLNLFLNHNAEKCNCTAFCLHFFFEELIFLILYCFLSTNFWGKEWLYFLCTERFICINFCEAHLLCKKK